MQTIRTIESNCTNHIYPSISELMEFVQWDMVKEVVAPYYSEGQLKSLAESGQFIVQVHFRSEEGEIDDCSVKVGSYTWDFNKLPSKVSRGRKVLTPFIVSVDHTIDCESVIKKFVVHNLAAALAEGAANYLSSIVGTDSIRLAFGYPICPIHSYKKDVLNFLGVNKIYKFISTFGIIPGTSICGVIIPK